MRTRDYLAVIAVVALTIALFACSKKADERPATGKPGEINWVGYTEGMAKSRSTGKPVMVDFYTTWCKYCVLLEDTTYKDPAIINILNDSFIAIKVNAEGTESVMDNGKTMSERDLAAVYKVNGYPTLWFFDAKGAPIGPVPGYNPPEDFKPILTYITSESNAKGIKYADYLKGVQKPAAKTDAGK